MKADHDLLKSVWECTEIKESRWKILHPSDTKEEKNVGISSEDEAEGLEVAPGVARQGTGRPAALEVQPARIPTTPSSCSRGRSSGQEEGPKTHETAGVSPSSGEDLPEGAQAREIAEVPYEVPVVPRGETTCPVCKQVFKTHHRVTVHMGIHQGEKFPCGKCGKVLATRRYWTEHTQSCVHGKRVTCPVCRKLFASAQTMHKHHKANMGLIPLCLKVGLYAHSVPNHFR